MEPSREIEHAIELQIRFASLLSYAMNPRARFSSLTLERDESRAQIGLISYTH